MNNRIKELRTKLLKERDNKKYTQKDFAERLGLSENFVWQIEKGDRIPSDRTISDICREFGVRKEWLLDGSGKAFAPERDTEAEIIDKFMEDCENPLRSTIVAIMKAYMSSTPDDQKAIRRFAESLKSENK